MEEESERKQGREGGGGSQKKNKIRDKYLIASKNVLSPQCAQSALFYTTASL